MNSVPRHYYNPTHAQRVELRLKAMQIRAGKERRRVAQQLQGIGFNETQAEEMAGIHMELRK